MVLEEDGEEKSLSFRTLRCITGNILQNRIHNKDICSICKIQVIRRTRIGRRMENRLDKMEHMKEEEEDIHISIT